MKVRTIDELHDKDIGNRKFANVCDLLIANNHKIGTIKEYYEYYKVEIDDKPFWYYKNWKASAKDFAKYVEDLLNMNKEIEQMKSRG